MPGTPTSRISSSLTFYLDLVNRAYRTELAKPITTADLNGNDPRIVRRVEAYFREQGIAGGRFSHYKPAAVLIREQAVLLPNRWRNVDRAARLFDRLNSLLHK